MSGAVKKDESVEEILSSIREVMSENLNKETQAKSPVATKSKDVLVLTTALQEDGTIKDLGKREAKMSTETKAKSSQAEQKATESIQAHSKGPVDILMSPSTVAESISALAELSNAPAAKAQAQSKPLKPEHIGDYSVEELVREMLKPMIKDWLDAHLPSLVKWMVTEQIEKMCQEQRKSK